MARTVENLSEMSVGRDDIVAPIPHNRKVITVTEPQVWAALGVLAAALASTITAFTTSLNRTMNARFDRVDTRIDALRDVVDTRFGSVEGRLDRVERHLDALDTDVAAITKRLLD